MPQLLSFFLQKPYPSPSVKTKALSDFFELFIFLRLYWTLLLYLLELCSFIGKYADSTTVPVFEISIINASMVVLKVNITFWLMPGRQKLL